VPGVVCPGWFVRPCFRAVQSLPADKREGEAKRESEAPAEPQIAAFLEENGSVKDSPSIDVGILTGW